MGEPRDRSHGSDISGTVLDADYVYDALGDRRRRYVCRALAREGKWSLSDPAARVAAWERDVSVDEIGDYHREQVALSLYHAHVPKLAADGVVAFDEATETVSRGENAGQVVRALEGVDAYLDAT